MKRMLAGTLAFTMCALATLSAWWGVVSDVSGRHLGALFGLMNSLGGVGAISLELPQVGTRCDGEPR